MHATHIQVFTVSNKKIAAKLKFGFSNDQPNISSKLGPSLALFKKFNLLYN